MEARSLLSGVSSNSTPLLQQPKKSIFVTLPSPYSSFNQSLKWVSFKTRYSSKLVSERVGTKMGLECKNSVDKVGDFTATDDYFLNGVRRKKLAVFVSGGGSNFRSIREAAIQGSVHGDVVVLVTNKPGKSWRFLPLVEGRISGQFMKPLSRDRFMETLF